MHLRGYKTAAERKKAVEQALGLQLPHIGYYSFDEHIASSKNCENMIGVAQVPLGIAGPVNLHGEYAQGDFFLPLATTEGALVASVSRGCKAINLSGGAIASTYRAGQTRGP